ncbi:solute carrier family 25 member 36-A-like [Asterias amurensis]|uniref:solute carrier family 25 member 36-A-like n=1 Tax=Asterias amurensis TaxID=7602 RepID=UPI003AB84D67
MAVSGSNAEKAEYTKMHNQMVSAHMTHVIAGGAGGTVGAILTCPLEVIKTRLQSSNTCLRTEYIPTVSQASLSTANGGVAQVSSISRQSLGVVKCLRYVVEKEGVAALFRGLGPNLIGVAPSRAIYFGAYAETKGFLNDRLTPESSLVHLLSAGFAGFTACTLTNPIWLVKTRLQLEQVNGKRHANMFRCAQYVHSREGIRGFYRGISASYMGISETAIHFVIYEHIKSLLTERESGLPDERKKLDFVKFMGAAAMSKTIAATVAYPHEVARTRLREEGNKYRSFVQTLLTVAREEGYRGIYGGLTTHLVRQIPNTAIMMCTYEFIVYLFNRV